MYPMDVIPFLTAWLPTAPLPWVTVQICYEALVGLVVLGVWVQALWPRR